MRGLTLLARVLPLVLVAHGLSCSATHGRAVATAPQKVPEARRELRDLSVAVIFPSPVVERPGTSLDGVDLVRVATESALKRAGFRLVLVDHADLVVVLDNHLGSGSSDGPEMTFGANVEFDRWVGENFSRGSHRRERGAADRLSVGGGRVRYSVKNPPLDGGYIHAELESVLESHLGNCDDGRRDGPGKRTQGTSLYLHWPAAPLKASPLGDFEPEGIAATLVEQLLSDKCQDSLVGLRATLEGEYPFEGEVAK